MKNRRTLYVCALLVATLGIAGEVFACPPPYITEPDSWDTVFYGAEIEATCSGGTPPLTWSGDGSFYPSTGDSVTWTAPSSGSTATITVTDALDRTDSVTVYLTNIVYVDADAGAYGDGMSWGEAFRYLRDALNAAGEGCEIWVAEGTYYPDDREGIFRPSRNDYFNMRSNVEVYGGFAGTESSRSSRDPASHPTILSGDINQDSTYTGNSYHVVRFYGDWSAVLDGFTVTDGYAENNSHGAGIAVYYCSPTIANCIVEDNQSVGADANGAGMYCYSASPTVTDCDFLDNVAGGDGGAIANEHSASGSFSGCTISGNSCGGDGGGVFFTDGCNGSFSNCDFLTNHAGDDGGAAAVECGNEEGDTGSSPSFSYCDFTENTSAEDGGAVHNKGDGSDPSYTNCDFERNEAEASGPDEDGDAGAMAWKDGSAGSASHCTFTLNEAADNGGAVFSSRGDDDDGSADLPSLPSFTECVFDRNKAGKDGGAVHCKENGSDPHFEFTYCDFVDNNSVDDGGAFQCESGSDPVISNCTFRKNEAGGHAGAINCFRSKDGTDGGSPTITDCTIGGNEDDGNTAGKDGGGINMTRVGSDPVITNTTITWNHANENGGGLAIKKYADPVDGGGNTIANNNANGSGDDIYDPHGKW